MLKFFFGMAVAEALRELGIDFKIVEFPENTRTSQDAALAIGCKLEQIGKSIVFRTKSGKAVIVLASGPTRINEHMLELYVREPVSKADASFVKEKTGYAIGGVPPVGYSGKIDVYIDEDLLKCEEIWAAAGTSHSVFRISKNDLLKIPGKVIRIV
jgi:prolyl-tRNA editing enzyme YbaK/EbsC (Cys-tRNA(Pro) deacylase)